MSRFRLPDRLTSEQIMLDCSASQATEGGYDMFIGSVRTGDWFKHGGEIFVKMGPFMQGQITYWAVSVVSGRAEFPAPTDSATAIRRIQVELVEKPDLSRLPNLIPA